VTAAEARLTIVSETDEFVVLDKPGGLVCHPTKGDAYSSLIGRLRLYFQDTDVEPRFVNRLDRETSGLVLVSKERPAHKVLCRALEQAEKGYLAVVEGVAPESGRIEEPLGKAQGSAVVVKQAVVTGGKPSITEWKRLATGKGYSLLALRPRTGRMHQIRVHLQWLGFPLVGEKLYGHDESLYLEFTQHDWTPRLEANLKARRQLLSAVHLSLAGHTWQIEIPDDIRDFTDWDTESLSVRSVEWGKSFV